MKGLKVKNFKYSVYYLWILFLFSCSKCKQPFEPNSNLELLLKSDWDSFFNPVWAPNGKEIYYLRAHSDNLPTWANSLGIGGELWKINLDTRETRFLLKGPFCSLAISPDGDLLALSYETGDNEIEWEGGPLILVDTSGNILDTLPTSLPLILDVEFNSDGSKLYYYAYDTVNTGIPFGFYRINLDGSSEELIKIEEDKNRAFFGLIEDTVVWRYKNCKLNPLRREFIVFIEGNVILCCSEIKIKNLETEESFTPDADPYGPPEEISGFESAYWSPDGEKLIISMGKVQKGDVVEVENLELWILNKVW